MKKYVFMIIGAAVIAMAMSASADEGRTETITEETNQEELLIAPAPTSDELLIAPSPDAVVEHDAEDGERTIDETINTPENYNENTGEEKLDSAFGSSGTEDEPSNHNILVQFVLIVGTAVALLIALIYIRKK